MKKLFLLILLSGIPLLGDKLEQPKDGYKQYTKPEFYSIGLLPEGYTFVCIDGYKWLQYSESDKIILEKLFYQDDESGKILPHKCL